MRLLMQRLTLLFLLITVIVAMTTMILSWRADNTKSEVTALEKQIEDVKLLIRVLEGEWSQLNRPERLKELAEIHLDIEKFSTYNQISHISQLPTRSQVEEIKTQWLEKAQNSEEDTDFKDDNGDEIKDENFNLGERNSLQILDNIIAEETSITKPNEIKADEEDSSLSEDPIEALMPEIMEIEETNIDPIEELIGSE